MVSIRNSATMTPAGFPWYDQWGSARYASNNAFLHAVDYSVGNASDQATNKAFAKARV